MTEYVDGKKYRVTRTEVLTYVEHSFMGGPIFLGDNGRVVAADGEGVTADPVPDPLPTTEGSVVRYDFDGREITIVRGSALWIDAEGDYLSDADLTGFPWTLIYDAGAQQS